MYKPQWSQGAGESAWERFLFQEKPRSSRNSCRVGIAVVVRAQPSPLSRTFAISAACTAPRCKFVVSSAVCGLCTVCIAHTPTKGSRQSNRGVISVHLFLAISADRHLRHIGELGRLSLSCVMSLLEQRKALALPRITYERERSQAEASENLIAFEDVNESVRRQQIEEIQRLYNESPQTQQNSLTFAPYAHSHLPNVGGSDWRSISFPTRLSHASAMPTPTRELSWQHDGLGNSVPSSSTNQGQNYQPKPSFLWKQDSFQTSQDIGRGPTSPMNNAPLIVPFRPMSTRLINGDLIDLGEPDGLDMSLDAIHQFDPLWRPQEVAPVIADMSDATPTVEAGWSVPPEIPNRTSSLIPSKDIMLEAPDSKAKSEYTADDLSIHTAEPISAKQLYILRSSHSYPTFESNFLFYAPVVDYYTTSASSVKITVLKDYSWPRSVDPSDDYISFTCNTSTTISEILNNVLMTFLSPEELSANGQIPTDQYGLKIFGLDEFVPINCKVGQCPHLAKALTFGKDFRLEIGKLQTLTSSTSNARNTPRKHFSRACVQESELNVVLDVLKKEMRKAEENFGTDLFPASTHAVLQTLKSLCVLFHRVEPFDLWEAIMQYSSAETKTDFLRYTAEIYAAVFRLIHVYTRSSNAKFRLDSDPRQSSDDRHCDDRQKHSDELRPIRDVVDVTEKILIFVESVHNLPEEWVATYESFYMAVHLIHGTAELTRGWCGVPCSVDTSSFFPSLKMNLWVRIQHKTLALST
uniref:Phosphatidylinositol 3-kinase n=1 Tax=Steinernema glaseri TaxID=37863 RepID=A0A1I8A3H4_9BILA